MKFSKKRREQLEGRLSFKRLAEGKYKDSAVRAVQKAFQTYDKDPKEKNSGSYVGKRALHEANAYLSTHGTEKSITRHQKKEMARKMKS